MLSIALKAALEVADHNRSFRAMAQTEQNGLTDSSDRMLNTSVPVK